MITNRRELREWLDYERTLYPINWFDIITRNQLFYNWKYVKLLRYSEYYRNSGKKYLMPLFVLTRIRKNLLGKSIGIEIGDNCCDKGLTIYHNGSIVINGHAKIGKNLKLHGSNCIGNMSEHDLKCPVIGDNVEFGVGSIAIGDIHIGNNIKIGANAVCIHDCIENDVTLVGTPAVVVRRRYAE